MAWSFCFCCLMWYSVDVVLTTYSWHIRSICSLCPCFFVPQSTEFSETILPLCGGAPAPAKVQVVTTTLASTNRNLCFIETSSSKPIRTSMLGLGRRLADCQK